MVTRVPRWLLRHEVSVEPYEGEGAYGPAYGPASRVRALVIEQARLVRAPDGSEAISSASLIAAPDLICPVGSRVTVPGGRITTALAVARHTAPGLPVPANCEVTLQ